jgi:HJR/Mrr/RecB family endonuclease
MSDRRDAGPIDTVLGILFLMTLLFSGPVASHIGFLRRLGFLGVLAVFVVLAAFGTILCSLVVSVHGWLQARKRCPHGVRAGSKGECNICIADEQKIKEQRETEAQRWRQRQELQAAAKNLRGQEIERLSKAWLSNTEAYLHMGPQQFENAIAELFRKLGYQVKQTPYSNDGGKDAIAKKNGEKVVIECKRYSASNSIGRRDLQIFAAAMHDVGADRGIYINTGVFTSTAKKYASVNQITLYDRNTLPQLVNEAYPTPVEVSDANVMCVECGAITRMPVVDLPTTGTCLNGHAMTSNVVKADLRVFSSTGIPNCEICGAPMRVVNGRRGQFWGCSRYPRCKSSQTMPEAAYEQRRWHRARWLRSKQKAPPQNLTLWD